jgi:(p)ppGpp synthase/HD superfamily hydrolase
MSNLYTTRAVEDSNRIIMKAIQFAANLHRFQRRKGGNHEESKNTPYINHPIDVVEVLTDCGIKDWSVLCAAALHDVVEDTVKANNITEEALLKEIAEKFTPETAAIVHECTDDKKLDKITRKKLQLEHASSASNGAKLVKLADKYANCNDTPPSHWSPAELLGYTYWSFAVVRAAKGVDAKLDQRLDELFLKKYGISPELSQSELDQHLVEYYKVIEHSE